MDASREVSSKRTLTSSESTSCETETKKQRVNSEEKPIRDHDINNNNNEKDKAKEIIDFTQTLGIKAGSRIEVRWELDFDDDDVGDGHDSVKANNAESENESKKTLVVGTPQQQTRSETRWWGGTLLEADGRLHTLKNRDDEATVPIHTIDYDPYPPSFPDRSIEDVCFLSNRSLLNVSSLSRTCWRLEGDSWEPSAEDLEEVDFDSPQLNRASGANEDDDEISVASTSQEDGLREVLDTILKAALESSGVMAKMQTMDRSRQSFMAEKIASTKEKLVSKLLEKLNNEGDDEENQGVHKVITPELVQNVMAELGNELRG